MKRVPNHLRTLVLGALGAATAAACSTNLPVDSTQGNPFVPPPIGIIQGTATYYGPAPCVKDGHVEGVLIVLLFDYDNPPPPAGLATTALNLATVPGDRMFPNYIPATGPGSASDTSHKEVCGQAGGPTIQATTTWTLSEVLAGRYQIRAFYSMRNTFNPLFDYANLPVAGDIGGAALADPTTGNFMQITVGVPTNDTKDYPNGLMIPPEGFVAQNVPVIVGQPFLSSRPYFWIDPNGSRGFGNEKPPVAGEKGVAYPQADTISDTSFAPVFPQDLGITGQQNITEGANVCISNNPDPACDVFKYAQASLPQLHFRYGFPTAGNLLGSSIKSGDDLGIVRSARITNPLAGGNTPFYGLEPFPIDIGATDVTKTAPKESQRFNLTRVFAPTIDRDTGAVGPLAPSILHDNQNLESVEVAELYPLVVLAKLQENADGLPVDPPTPQTDPVVIIQGITLRNDKNGNGTMKATSQSGTVCGGLTNQDTTNCVGPDPTKALNQADGLELLDNFTTLVRPATLCVRPNAANANPKGILVAPFQKDFNPQNLDSELVDKKRLLQVQANKLSDIQFGCLPPGYYSVNVVYPLGQAWGIPDMTGYCGFGLPKLINGQWTDGPSFEACMYGSPAPDNGTTYSKRPLLVSQQVFLDGGPHNDPTKNKHPLILQIQPSLRCMSQVDEQTGQDLNHNGRTGEKGVWVNKPADEDANANGILDGTKGQPDYEDKNGNGILDMNIPNACLPTCRDPNGTEKGSTNCVK